MDVDANLLAGRELPTSAAVILARVPAKKKSNALGERIRQLRGTRTLKDVDAKAGIGVSKLSKLERGAEINPRLDTLRAVARGLDAPLNALFSQATTLPRPEGDAGHAATDTTAQERAQILERALAAIDREFPADDSWEGDIHKAIAALNRALRRGRATGTVTRAPIGLMEAEN